MPTNWDDFESLRISIDELTARVEVLEKQLEKKARPKREKSAKEDTPGAAVRRQFLESWKARFGNDYPAWGAKENGLAGSWLRSVSLENALLYCKIYPFWDRDSFVIKAGHPFHLLVTKCVQLDADMKRYPEKMKMLAKSQTREKMIVEEHQKQAEVLIHAERIGNPSPNQQVGFDGCVQIPNQDQQRVPGERDPNAE